MYPPMKIVILEHLMNLKEVRYNIVLLKLNAHVDFNNIRYNTVKKIPPMHGVDTVVNKFFHFSLYACISLQATKWCKILF